MSEATFRHSPGGGGVGWKVNSLTYAQTQAVKRFNGQNFLTQNLICINVILLNSESAFVGLFFKASLNPCTWQIMAWTCLEDL